MLPCKGERIILLSFFDGLGAAPLALQQLVGPPRLHLSWETDDACNEVLRQHFPNMEARGDFLLDDPQKIAQKIREADPHSECLILATAGPPCPDFSVVN